MKRFLTLLSAFLALTTVASAQIHIEKRHFNRGWYVSHQEHRRKTDPVPPRAKTAAVRNPQVTGNVLPDTAEAAITEMFPVLPAQQHRLVPSHKAPSVKKTAAPCSVTTPGKASALPLQETSALQDSAPRIPVNTRSADDWGDNIDFSSFWWKFLLCIVIAAILAWIIFAMGGMFVLAVIPTASDTLVTCIVLALFYLVYGIIEGIVWLCKNFDDWWPDKLNIRIHFPQSDYRKCNPAVKRNRGSVRHVNPGYHIGG